MLRSMTQKELLLIVDLLYLASEAFSNHNSNDFPLPKTWSKEERIALAMAYHEANGDPEEHDPTREEHLGDSSLMWFFSQKLREESEGG